MFRQHGYTGAAESILIAQRAQARQRIGGRGARPRRARRRGHLLVRDRLSAGIEPM